MPSSRPVLSCWIRSCVSELGGRSISTGMVDGSVHVSPASSLSPVATTSSTCLLSTAAFHIAMKIQHFILLSLLLGCCAVSAQTTNAFTNTNTPPSSRAIDLIQVGKDTTWTNVEVAIDKEGKDKTWTNTYVLHIDKRDGNKVEGVRLVSNMLDGQDKTMTSEWGIIAVYDPNSISLELASPDSPSWKQAFSVIPKRKGHCYIKKMSMTMLPKVARLCGNVLRVVGWKAGKLEDDFVFRFFRGVDRFWQLA